MIRPRGKLGDITAVSLAMRTDIMTFKSGTRSDPVLNMAAFSINSTTPIYRLCAVLQPGRIHFNEAEPQYQTQPVFL